ncbi:uncharacterized protein LOC124814433 [Hydra vulgaris]|uniref:uncharacterized protein LOC124814433 n=1 Tax=Hydra vulgaris TaxID=6087 RepID=UPI0032EA154A
MVYNLIDDVLKRFKTDNLADLNTFYETLLDTFIYNNNKMVSNEGLLSCFIDGTIRRNICAEVCIPSYLKDNKMHCIALRSEASGSCMYSSASLFFVADNTLMDVLRVLTSLEIYIHADYYCKHPLFSKIFSDYSSHFINLKSLLCMSVSHSALDSGFENNNIIKAEAIANCESTEKLAGFLCLLGLSSVLSCNIVSCYPDFGVEKYKIFFNQEISPRTPIKFCSIFYILFFYDGNFQSGTFQHNHYIPLIFIPKKRKLSSKSKIIISKKLLPVLSPNKFLDTKQTIDQVATIVPSTEAKNPNKKSYSILTFFHKTNPDLEPTSAILQNTSCILKSNSFSSQLAVSSSQYTTSFQSLTLNKDVSSHSKTSKNSVLSKSFFTKSKSSIRKVPNFYNNNIECPSNIYLPPKEVLNALQSFEQNDVAFFRQKVEFLSDHEIFLLTKNMFIRNEDYIFPKNSGRQFRYLWLKEFSWLRYSKSTDGAFCLSCVLFGNKFKLRSRKLTHLYLEPFKKWSDAIKSFSNHESTKNGLHAFTMPVFNIFLSHSLGISQLINVIIDTNVKEKIIKNRQILRPIVEAIIFCGQTNTPLRGHRDDSQYLPEAEEYSKCGTGCFNKLLNFAVRNGNDVLG